jgi:hypothetical protein
VEVVLIENTQKTLGINKNQRQVDFLYYS